MLGCNGGRPKTLASWRKVFSFTLWLDTRQFFEVLVLETVGEDVLGVRERL